MSWTISILSRTKVFSLGRWMRHFSKISVHITFSLTLVSEIQIESTEPYNNAKKTTIVDEQGLDHILASVKLE